MKVSVLLPVFNGERFVKRAINSVLKQRFWDFELIIVNDGSTDGTSAILESYSQVPKVQVWETENQGLAKALKLALKCAVGKYITYISHDDWWLPYKLEREVKVMDACSRKIGVAYSNFYKYYEATGTAKPIFASPNAQEQILDECGINMCSAIIRRSALLQLRQRDGYVLDQTMKDCVDWDLWIRLAQLCDFKYIPQLLTYYAIHRKQMTQSFSHGVIRWKLHLKWNGFKPKYFVNSVIRAYLRSLLGRK